MVLFSRFLSRNAGPRRRSRTSPSRRSCRPMLEALEARTLFSADSVRFVGQAYRDLLNREAEPGGLAFWSGLVDQGHSRAEIALGIATSPEFRLDEVQGL